MQTVYRSGALKACKPSMKKYLVPAALAQEEASRFDAR